MNIPLFIAYLLMFVGMIPMFKSESLRLKPYRVRRKYYIFGILVNFVALVILTKEIFNL
jgi:hypothetical protein